MKKLIYFFTILMISQSSLYSQTFENVNEYELANRNKGNKNNYLNKNRIGLQASMFTGWGPVYHRDLSKDLTLRLGFIAFGESSEDNSATTDMWGTFGTALQYNFTKNEDLRTFMFLSYSYWIDKSTNYDYRSEYIDNEYKSYSFMSKSVTSKNIPGIGLGFEFYFWNAMTLSVETGFLIRSEANSSTNKIYPLYNTSSNKDYYGYGVGANFNISF